MDDRETPCDETPTSLTARPGPLADPMADTLRRIAAEQYARVLRSIQEGIMSKKHYQALATALYQSQPAKDTSGNPADERATDAMRGTWWGVVYAISKALQADNPRFDRERFREACETGRCKGMRQVA